MKNKRENGEVVVEASIVVTLAFIVLSIMFYIGMVLYQQTAISVVANRTATNISQVYSNTLRDPFTGYIDPDNTYQPVTYSNMKTDAYLDSIQQKGNAFVQYRLKQSQIIPAVERNVDVNVVKKPNEVLKGQIVVEITDTYDVPLVGMFGLDSEISFTATGRADCVDYLEYMYGVAAVAKPDGSPIPSLPDSDTCIVTFVRDEYSGVFHAAEPVLRGKTMMTSNHYSHCKMPEYPVFNDMKCTGWRTKDGESFTAATQVDENMTVYAVWECGVTFDPDGGTVDPTHKVVEYKKTCTLPVPEKYSFKFLGWYTEPNGGGTKYESDITEIPGNITLYASWECIHLDRTVTKTAAKDCRSLDVYTYQCKTCPDSYQKTGLAGPCVEFVDKSSKLEPTCTKPAEFPVRCKYCNMVQKDKNGNDKVYVDDALGHILQAYKQAPTCWSEGFDGVRCTRHGCNYMDVKTSNMLGHTWDSGTITREATCSQKGIKTFKCTNTGCTATKREDIEMTAHKWDGRCGTIHDISANHRKIGSHDKSAGYQYSTEVECFLCANCGAPYNGWSTDKDANGVTIANGVICREHTEHHSQKNGTIEIKSEVNCKKYTDNDNMSHKVKHGE